MSTPATYTATSLLFRFGPAVLYFGVWLAGGLIVQQLFNGILHSVTSRNQSRLLQAFASAMRGIIAWVGGLIGFWFAYYNIRLVASQNVQLDRYLPRYLKAATVLLIVIFLARVIGRFITAYTAREDTRLPASSIISNLVRVVIYVLGAGIIIVTVWPGLSLTPLLGTLGVGGLTVGLALQSTLDNLFSGIQVLASRQIEPGDFVQLESGQEGIVEDVTWRNTTIRRITSELIIVPNSILGKSLVINYSRNAHAYQLIIPSTVIFGTDLELLKRVVIEAANETMEYSHYVYKEDTPEILITANNEAGVSFSTVLPIIAYRAKATVISDFLQRLQKHLAAANIHQPEKVIIPRT
jgi:small-conductance mechanosensitive channel